MGTLKMYANIRAEGLDELKQLIDEAAQKIIELEESLEKIRNAKFEIKVDTASEEEVRHVDIQTGNKTLCNYR